MDRIEELICGLIEDVGMMGMAVLNDDNVASLQYKDSAVVAGKEITDKWREMVGVLEEAYNLVRIARREYGIDKPSALAWLKLEVRLQSALTRAKGEAPWPHQGDNMPILYTLSRSKGSRQARRLLWDNQIPCKSVIVSPKDQAAIGYALGIDKLPALTDGDNVHEGLDAIKRYVSD